MKRFAVILPLLLLLVTSCKTRYITQEVPVVVEHTSTHHHTDIIRDTILQRDSIFHFVQGDTTIIEKWHHSVKVERVQVGDTIHDTIPEIVTQHITEQVVEYRQRWWQTALCWLGGIAIALIGITAGWIAWRLRH